VTYLRHDNTPALRVLNCGQRFPEPQQSRRRDFAGLLRRTLTCAAG